MRNLFRSGSMITLLCVLLAGCAPSIYDDMGLVTQYFTQGETGIIRFEVGPYQEGTAIIGPDEAAFWVKDHTAYTVNEVAETIAPELPQAPASIQYDDDFIAAAMADSEGYPKNPLLNISFGEGSVSAFDDRFSIPLCIFVLLITIISCRADWRCLLSLIPALLVISAVFTVTHFVYPETFSYFGLDKIKATRLTSIYCLSLTALWLALGVLAKRGVLTRIVLAFLVVTCVGMIGLLNYVSPAKGIAELVILSVVTVFGVAVARRACGSAPAWRCFLWSLLKFNLLALALLWLVAATLSSYVEIEFDPVFWLWGIPQAFTIGLASGLGLFAFEMLLFSVAAVSAFHRARLKAALGIAGTAAESNQTFVRRGSRMGTAVVFALGGVFAIAAYGLVEEALFSFSAADFDAEMEDTFSFGPPEIPGVVPVSLDFEVEDMAGTPLNLEEAFEGKVVFLNTWATWCPPCIAELPSIAALYEKLGHRVAFACISDEDRETIQRFLEENDYALPVFRAKGDLPPEFETDSIPATFVVSAERERVLKHVGAANWAHDSVVAFLEGLLDKTDPKEVLAP